MVLGANFSTSISVLTDLQACICSSVAQEALLLKAALRLSNNCSWLQQVRACLHVLHCQMPTLEGHVLLLPLQLYNTITIVLPISNCLKQLKCHRPCKNCFSAFICCERSHPYLGSAERSGHAEVRVENAVEAAGSIHGMLKSTRALPPCSITVLHGHSPSPV